MAPQFTSAPTKHVVRPLLPAPCPVTLPVLLTNIIPEQFPLPRMLMDIDPRRALTPPPTVHRVPTPAPRRRHTPDSRESSLTPAEDDDSGDESSDSSSATKKPNGLTQIPRPSGANIQTVKSLFKDRYPDLTEQEQEQKYTEFSVSFFFPRYINGSLMVYLFIYSARPALMPSARSIYVLRWRSATRIKICAPRSTIRCNSICTT